jgi:hypothetical protein
MPIDLVRPSLQNAPRFHASVVLLIQDSINQPESSFLAKLVAVTLSVIHDSGIEVLAPSIASLRQLFNTNNLKKLQL